MLTIEREIVQNVKKIFTALNITYIRKYCTKLVSGQRSHKFYCVYWPNANDVITIDMLLQLINTSISKISTEYVATITVCKYTDVMSIKIKPV